MRHGGHSKQFSLHPPESKGGEILLESLQNGRDAFELGSIVEGQKGETATYVLVPQQGEHAEPRRERDCHAFPKRKSPLIPSIRAVS